MLFSMQANEVSVVTLKKQLLLLVIGLSSLNRVAIADGQWPTPGELAPASAEVQAFKESLVGVYGHYDVVAYSEKIAGIAEMKTYVITYGISELALGDDGRLIAKDRYCHASHKSNLPFKSEVPDSFTQAILPRTVEVQIRQAADGQLFMWRPETPTPIGVRLADPMQALPKHPRDAQAVDDDGDGKPGVTVRIKLYNHIPTELYIARREIFAYALTPQADGKLTGYVSDHSEQLVLGSPLVFLRSQRDPKQHPDLNLSPMMLVPIDASYDCQTLMESRDQLFPAEPAIW